MHCRVFSSLPGLLSTPSHTSYNNQNVPQHYQILPKLPLVGNNSNLPVMHSHSPISYYSLQPQWPAVLRNVAHFLPLGPLFNLVAIWPSPSLPSGLYLKVISVRPFVNILSEISSHPQYLIASFSVFSPVPTAVQPYIIQFIVYFDKRQSFSVNCMFHEVRQHFCLFSLPLYPQPVERI